MWGGIPRITERMKDMAETKNSAPEKIYADLLAEAVKLPEVAAAFEACKIIQDVIREGHDNLSDMVMHFMEAAEPARTALAPLTAVKDAANG